MKEVTVEQYLVKRVKQLRGEVRKVVFPTHKGAPDRLVCVPARKVERYERYELLGVMLPTVDTSYFSPAIIALVELKNPDTIATFPASAHERAQAREHDRLRAAGMRVEVIGTREQVDAFLGV